MSQPIFLAKIGKYHQFVVSEFAQSVVKVNILFVFFLQVNTWETDQSNYERAHGGTEI